MHRKRKNKSPREALEFTKMQTTWENTLNKCKKKGTNNATKMHQKSKPNANEKQNNCDQKRSVALYVRLVLFAILLLFFGKFCAFPWENAKFAAKNMPEKHRTNIAHKTHKHREKHTKKVVCKIWLCMCILCAFWSLLFCVV